MLRNEGADVAAHEMIRRAHDEAEGMERLSAEYLTLATLAQGERWDALLVRSGLTDAELDAVRASEAHGPLLAAFREAEARGLDIEATFPQPGCRSIPGRRRRRGRGAARPGGALDPGGRWRRRSAGNLIAGLIPRVQGVSDPRWPGPWPSVTRPWKDVPARWPNKRSSREKPGCISRARSERPGTASALAAQRLDGRGLPGPLAYHRIAQHREPRPRREHRTDE